MKNILLALAMILTVCGTVSAQDGVIPLPLKEAIKMAVEKNLDVRAELFNPAASEADIRKSMGIYNPVLNLLANYQNSNYQAATITATGENPVTRTRSTAFNAGVNQLVPFGGTAGVSFNNSYNQNNFDTGLDSYYQSNVALTYTQPLLKNFGRETTELTINVSRFAKEGALDQFKTRLQDIITQVKSQYNQLYSLRKNLEVKKTSLELAETILKNTNAQVKAGVLPAMEILNAQFGVATQQKNLIDAERLLKDQVDLLRNLLQLGNVTDIIPVDTPLREQYAIEEELAIKTALAERPDLQALRVTVKTNELQSRVFRNQTLPQLDLTTSAAFNGLGNSYNRDLDRVGSGRYPVWYAGLQFTYPIGNDSARNDYIKSRLKVEQAQTQVKSLEESISRDVRIAIRAVSSGYKQLEVTARGRSYAEEVLQAYIKKQKVGLATTKDVLDVLSNLVAAQGTEIQAVTDYNNAIVNLWKTTGELLAKEGINIGEKESDSLYNARN